MGRAVAVAGVAKGGRPCDSRCCGIMLKPCACAMNGDMPGIEAGTACAGKGWAAPAPLEAEDGGSAAGPLVWLAAAELAALIPASEPAALGGD